MKRQFLLAAAIALSSFAMAQSTPRFGVRGGITSSGMQGDAVKSLNGIIDYSNGMVTTATHTGFFGGVYAGIPVSDNVSIEPALYYTQKGYALQGDFNLKGAEFLGANAKAQLNANYIDLPVVVKGNFGGFQVFAGPQVSYLLNADLHSSAGVLGFNLLNSHKDATSQFNRVDAALTGGIGYRFANGLNVTASYDHGLSKVDANKNFDAYNRSFKVGLGFDF
ncbi:MAG TPA: porin family protein [Flavisolibacter sp.]|jgi:hypothetical protein|nr:porin family protein [Flavisolibacter sp.]